MVKQTLRQTHWNAGNSWWENKGIEITVLILEEDPDMLIISEANRRDSIVPELKHIEGYYMITPNTSNSMGYSRLILLVKEGVRVNIMDDCMSDEIPAIWVKLVSRGRKPIVIGGLYRKHHLLLQPLPKTSDDKQLQINRWKKSIKGWRKAARNAKCILIGDLYLDYMRWATLVYRIHKMVQHTKDEIETQGFCQLSWPGQPSSLVDHIWTNSPGSIMTTKNVVRAVADHNYISTVIRTKDRKEQEHEVQRRDIKHMDINIYKLRLQNLD